MSSTNNHPIGRPQGEIIIDNYIQRNRANQFLVMAFLEERNNARLDIINLLRSNPTPEVIQSCLAKLEAANYSDTNVNQINPVPIQNSIESNQQKQQLESNPNSVMKPVRFANSPRKCIATQMKFIVVKLKCTEANCESVFKSMAELELHLASRKHGILLYRCPQMGCKFSAHNMNQLVDHKKKKHQLNSFQCKECLRNFNQISTLPAGKDRFESLLKHYKENHYEGEFKCTICKAKTSTIFQANKHYYECSKAKLAHKPVANQASFSINPYSYPFPPASPIHVSHNSTTINNTINQHLQPTAVNNNKHSQPSLRQKLADALARQSPINLTEQSKLRFMPGNVKARKDFSADSKQNSDRILRSN